MSAILFRQVFLQGLDYSKMLLAEKNRFFFLSKSFCNDDTARERLYPTIPVVINIICKFYWPNNYSNYRQN